ncbi:DUF2515 domain-containing protein [Anaerobacillus alkaliphilus]|uniref:DUF2515 domain-containing protein n=1 Tax=Anaerobacillus alkaliphilus TaxID=1548597 RepID=A0A4Q0VXJ2_9BACI|nr:DUF2515 domain-containing protein [Anaerobacillus alkaliphilus]RXJ04112.1 DUF2515 domain-containing protein [Anaerobacillus alkaliphilus]
MFDQVTNVLKKAIQLPKHGIDLLADTYESNKYEKSSTKRWNKLSFSEITLQDLQRKLADNKQVPTPLTQANRALVKEIETKTHKLNRNNVTRTKAYLDFYQKHPEIHWAFLAHLVSRNGGWNMTDLKGSMLPKIISSTSCNDFFSFLERANALIFHDAYPQLLLYEASKQKGRNLFYLLPKFHVSTFMRTFWDYFLERQDSQLLTVALIINEQNYIEKRVIHHPDYKEKVLDNILFKLQELLQFTYVLFPYQVKPKKTRLAGTTVSDFANVNQRVEIGKKLYCTLFGYENLGNDIYQFASTVPHTASRSDYWPEMFTKDSSTTLQTVSISCKPTKPIVYSPTLDQAWKDVDYSFTDRHDWFERNDQFLHYFKEITTPPSFDLSRQYCQDINKMLAASTAAEMIKP